MADDLSPLRKRRATVGPGRKAVSCPCRRPAIVWDPHVHPKRPRSASPRRTPARRTLQPQPPLSWLRLCDLAHRVAFVRWHFVLPKSRQFAAGNLAHHVRFRHAYRVPFWITTSNCFSVVCLPSSSWSANSPSIRISQPTVSRRSERNTDAAGVGRPQVDREAGSVGRGRVLSQTAWRRWSSHVCPGNAPCPAPGRSASARPCRR